MTRNLLTTLCLLIPALHLSTREASAQVDDPVGPASDTCTYVFGSGNGVKQLNYCVSDHANLMSFVSPAAVEYIRQTTLVEGYAVCSTTNGVHGFDAGASGGESPGWGAATVLSGPTAAGVTIGRTTPDGRVRLETTFGRDTKEMEVLVSVKVINLTTASLVGVQYARYADFDVPGPSPGNFATNLFVKTPDGVAAFDTAGGISLNVGNYDLPHTTRINADIASGFSNCLNTLASGGVLSPSVGDRSARIVYDIGTLAAGRSKTVKFIYKRQ